MGYGGGGGGGGGSGGGGGGSGGGGGGAAGYGAGGSGAGGASGYRRVGDDRTANLKVNNITNRDGSSGTEVDGIVEVNTTAHFIPPVGNTAERGSRGRGLFGLLYSSPSNTNTIEYATIATLGNTRDFGDLTQARRYAQTSSSSTRAVTAGGYVSSANDTIDYVEIHSTGNAFDFGNLLENGYDGAGVVSDGIRGYFMGDQPGGNQPSRAGKLIQYITFANKGNGTDYGDLSQKHIGGAKCSSSTRGVIGGGSTPSGDSVEYITLGTTGTSFDFGDLTTIRNNHSSTGSPTRGLFVSGQNPSFTNAIDYITIASTGNALDFGDTIDAVRGGGATSNSIRGIFAGGYTPTAIKNIAYVNIATTGNASDFGDLIGDGHNTRACSDSHGGLG